MRRLARSQCVIASVVLGLLCATACFRPAGAPSDPGAVEAIKSDDPFDKDGVKAESSGLDSGGAPDSAKNQLPFRDTSNLPAGTLLSVRLTNPISASDAGNHSRSEAKVLEAKTFEATIDDPVVVRGDTVIPRGAVVDGRVESVRASDVKPSRGYIRLALASIQVDGLEIPVETSSLFVRQAALTDASPSAMHLEKGRRLTFRLTNPVYVSRQRTRAGR
jgi:hypothetical protein